VVSWSEFLATDPEARVRFPVYHIFWEVVGLERGPLSLVSTIEELLRRNSSSGLESREYGRRDPSRWPRDSHYSQKLAVTSSESGCRSVGIVRSRTQATEFSFSFSLYSSANLFWSIGFCLEWSWISRRKCQIPVPLWALAVCVCVCVCVFVFVFVFVFVWWRTRWSSRWHFLRDPTIPFHFTCLTSGKRARCIESMFKASFWFSREPAIVYRRHRQEYIREQNNKFEFRGGNCFCVFLSSFIF
jgi:hypothetical protein